MSNEQIFIPRVITFEFGNGDTAYKLENMRNINSLSENDVEAIMKVADETNWSIADIDDDPDFGIRLQCYAEPMTTYFTEEFNKNLGDALKRILTETNF